MEDWIEQLLRRGLGGMAHHDIAIVDHEGKLVAEKRIGDDAAGFAELTQLLADAATPKTTGSRSPSRPRAA
ncbi:hypothetical protein ACFYU5_35990 [Nocardia aobensis]|uniref:Uncharacterized protein n=1 Tax=Nocardia aobensis TaxID=257277 RepID=A0ABW6PF69_9NOCA